MSELEPRTAAAASSALDAWSTEPTAAQTRHALSVELGPAPGYWDALRPAGRSLMRPSPQRRRLLKLAGSVGLGLWGLAGLGMVVSGGARDALELIVVMLVWLAILLSASMAGVVAWSAVAICWRAAHVMDVVTRGEPTARWMHELTASPPPTTPIAMLSGRIGQIIFVNTILSVLAALVTASLVAVFNPDRGVWIWVAWSLVGVGVTTFLSLVALSSVALSARAGQLVVRQQLTMRRERRAMAASEVSGALSAAGFDDQAAGALSMTHTRGQLSASPPQPQPADESRPSGEP